MFPPKHPWDCIGLLIARMLGLFILFGKIAKRRISYFYFSLKAKAYKRNLPIYFFSIFKWKGTASTGFWHLAKAEWLRISELVRSLCCLGHSHVLGVKTKSLELIACKSSLLLRPNSTDYKNISSCFVRCRTAVMIFPK